MPSSRLSGSARGGCQGEAFGRAGHLVAEHGDRGIHVLLIGHLDTVFEPDSPFQKFERISATSARGPGTTDMKGGNVIIVEAIRALRAAGVLQDLQLTVILIGDEESSGRPLQSARAALGLPRWMQPMWRSGLKMVMAVRRPRLLRAGATAAGSSR